MSERLLLGKLSKSRAPQVNFPHPCGQTAAECGRNRHAAQKCTGHVGFASWNRITKWWLQDIFRCRTPFLGVWVTPKCSIASTQSPRTWSFFFNLIFRHTQFVHFAQAKKASQKAKVLLSKWEKIPGWGRHGILRPQDHQDQRTRHLLLGSLLIVTVGQSLECSLFHCLVSKDFPEILILVLSLAKNKSRAVLSNFRRQRNGL